MAIGRNTSSQFPCARASSPASHRVNLAGMQPCRWNATSQTNQALTHKSGFFPERLTCGLGGHENMITKTPESGLALLTNGIGGMARLRVDLGNIQSKYDCLLGANLHPTLPVDRHIFAKRARVWVNADGFLAPLNKDNLI